MLGPSATAAPMPAPAAATPGENPPPLPETGAGAIGAPVVAAAGAVAAPRLVRYRPMPMARLTASSTTPISTAHTTPWLCWSSSCVLMCAPKEMGAIV